MKKYILMDEETVRGNEEVRKIIKNYDLMSFHRGKRFRVLEFCKELAPYGEVFEV